MTDMREALQDILANASDCGVSQGKTGDAWIAARSKEIAEEALSAPQPAAPSGRLCRWVSCGERMPLAPGNKPDIFGDGIEAIINQVIVLKPYEERYGVVWHDNEGFYEKYSGDKRIPYDPIAEDWQWLEELPPQPEPSEDEVERVARAICSTFGDDPDGVTAINGKLVWQTWTDEAKAAIDARPKVGGEGVDIEAALLAIWLVYKAETNALDWMRESYDESALQVLLVALSTWNLKPKEPPHA